METYQQVSVFLGSIYECLKQLVFKNFILSNGKTAPLDT